MASVDEMRNQTGWDDFWNVVQSDMAACSPVALTAQQIADAGWA